MTRPRGGQSLERNPDRIWGTHTRCIPTVLGQKKRPAVHRALTRGVEHQNSSGCRGCSKSGDPLPLARTTPRRARRTAASTDAAPTRRTGLSHHGPCIRRRRNTPVGLRSGLYTRGAPQEDTAATPGASTRNSTAAATRSSGYSDGSRAFAGPFLVTTSLMSCSPRSFTSHSSPKPFGLS